LKASDCWLTPRNRSPPLDRGVPLANGSSSVSPNGLVCSRDSG
jgi:hypothetical protein